MDQPRSIDDDLKILDNKLNQLKREYEQYFLGTRPREPVLLAGEVRRLVAIQTNNPFPNTALKFKFSSICSRYQSFNRQWQDTLRKIEQGTYERHRFKADLHEREAAEARPAAAAPAGARADDPGIYTAYVEARKREESVAGEAASDLARAGEEPARPLRKRGDPLPRRGGGRKGKAQGLPRRGLSGAESSP
ncbi:MAG: hypothetical protein ACYSTY_09765 [Planctomycetota bacterium]